MKKLMFATALVASAAAFADPLNAISFEGYSADATVGNTADVPDASGGDNGMYFYFDGDGDGSSVKAFGSGDVVAPQITRPLFFASASPNLNYLELSTEGGTLWRSINTLSSTVGEGGTTYDLGTGQAIAADGTYFDSLVQFTPTEDGGAPELESADKLAIWLNVDSNQQTNLMVRAAVIDIDGGANPVATTFTITNKTVNAGEWYRLTVKAIPDIANGEGYPGFQIRLDGQVLMSDTCTMTPGSLEFMQGSDYETDLLNGALFASLGGMDDNPTLQGVGFKGSGAIDDIVWTEDDPFAGGAGGDDYHVTIGDAVVPITPQAGDLAALQAAIIAGGGTLDVTDVAAVNAALAAEIGSTGIPSWQALFLGLVPTEAGLEGFKIDSISFNEDGNVVVTLPADVTPMVGRGVAITIKLQSTSDLGGSWTDVESAGGQDNKTFAPVTPALGETKKFYKVVVEFAEAVPPPPPNGNE